MIVLSIALFLFVGLLVPVISGIEWLRRRAADEAGFLAFFDADAPHDHPVLLQALSGVAVTVDDGTSDLIPLGDLHLPSGRLVVADAACLGADPPSPLEVTFPGGTYPVVMVRHRRRRDQRVAAVAVLTAEAASMAYLTPAFAEGERERLRQHRALPSIGVDSATVALAPVEVLGHVPEEAGAVGLGTVNPYLSDDPADLASWTDTPAGRLIVVLSGLGDGLYPLWIGRANDGRPVAVIADFSLLGPSQPRSGPP